MRRARFPCTWGIYYGGRWPKGVSNLNTQPCIELEVDKLILTWKKIAYLHDFLESFSSTVRASVRVGRMTLDEGIDPNLDQLNWVMKTQQAQKWLLRETAMLLINGNCGEAKHSSVSFLTTFLVQNGTRLDIPVLHFFCEDEEGSSCHPATLLRSLVAQLAFCYDFDLLSNPELHEPTLTKLGKLFLIFRNLLAQLPEKTLLWIVIDEIAYIETKYENETILLVKQLLDISQATAPVVQLLVITSNKSYSVAEILHRQGGERGVIDGGRGWEILDVPAQTGTSEHRDRGRSQHIGPIVRKRYSKSLPDLPKMAGGWGDEGDGRDYGGLSARENPGRRSRMSDITAE